jgi:3D (Asp-Asp-Asp) domain-containing protein
MAPIQQIYDKQAIFTAYTLNSDETDQSPCIGAGNHNLCEIRQEDEHKCIAGTRLYPLHTRLFIEGFGECEILDRTSEKYWNRIDIVFPNKKEAFKFGKKILNYNVIQ